MGSMGMGISIRQTSVKSFIGPGCSAQLLLHRVENGCQFVLGPVYVDGYGGESEDVARLSKCR